MPCLSIEDILVRSKVEVLQWEPKHQLSTVNIFTQSKTEQLVTARKGLEKKLQGKTRGNILSSTF